MARQALEHIRICDFTGILAGAGATRFLAAFGAQVIRVEDPVKQGRWDLLRGIGPFKEGQKGLDVGGSFNNHNVHKLGITLNTRTERGMELLKQLISVSDVVTENFSATVFDRWGLSYEQLREIKDDIIYVSNCGFGHSGPYHRYKTYGPVIQAVSGLTFGSALPDREPAGWGYSYMDHTGAYYMCLGILNALVHRNRTGEGQWVDLGCAEAAVTLSGPAIMDYTVNGRPLRREGSPHANRGHWPPMAPHGIYRAAGDDYWIAISCRNETDWDGIRSTVNAPWCSKPEYTTLEGRLEKQDELDRDLESWTENRDPFEAAKALQDAGVAAAAVQKPGDRIDNDPNTSEWGLWPTVQHTKMGEVRVDGIPVHLSETDWELTRGGPCLGEHNDFVFGEILGLSAEEIASLREEGIV
ncbi:MAG: CaiB/BaiF CoA transferase family protein [Dehalococcoidia bacterium]